MEKPRSPIRIQSSPQGGSFGPVLVLWKLAIPLGSILGAALFTVIMAAVVLAVGVGVFGWPWSNFEVYFNVLGVILRCIGIALVIGAVVTCVLIVVESIVDATRAHNGKEK